ncbi:hypothetical protein FOA52_005383 [Chlamydomonas sp. UWO 241]|nr:hypothetical protein FOA52_005383 [Chlamydomonas sp. UWO 241]
MLKSPTSTDSLFLSECMHPMGGGLVGSGGNFSPLNATKSGGECAAELAEYFELDVGQYYVDVARVAAAARAHFDSLPDADKPHFSRVIVFDIDETTRHRRRRRHQSP